MTYVPNRIIKSDAFTDEKVIDKSALQRNLDLIANETNSLRNAIDVISRRASISRRIARTQTQFVKPFLFG